MRKIFKDLKENHNKLWEEETLVQFILTEHQLSLQAPGAQENELPLRVV